MSGVRTSSLLKVDGRAPTTIPVITPLQPVHPHRWRTCAHAASGARRRGPTFARPAPHRRAATACRRSSRPSRTMARAIYRPGGSAPTGTTDSRLSHRLVGPLAEFGLARSEASGHRPYRRPRTPPSCRRACPAWWCRAPCRSRADRRSPSSTTGGRRSLSRSLPHRVEDQVADRELVVRHPERVTSRSTLPRCRPGRRPRA